MGVVCFVMVELSLSLFGTFSGAINQQPLVGFESGKVRALLAYLACSPGRAHSREYLAGLLWPDFPDATARKNLRQALNNLRHVLNDSQEPAQFLLSTPDSLHFNQESRFWLDVSAFNDLLNACDTHPHRASELCRTCAQARERAVALYRGDFLINLTTHASSPFDDWAAQQREILRRKALSAFFLLATFYERTGAYEAAYQNALRQLALEPWREEAHRQAISALAALGQRSAAKAQYQACYQALGEELGVEPEEETRQLYRQLCVAPTIQALTHVRTSRTNLPVPPLSLIGRQNELACLIERLERADGRLVSLVGLGGIGKTRLALEVGRLLAAEFSGGVFFASLAALNQLEQLLPAIAGALNLPPAQNSVESGWLAKQIRGGDVLLILDGFDQLIAGANQLGELLRYAPNLSILVTSQERLKLEQEWVFDLDGLPAMDEAVQLFVRQAGMVQPGFELSEKNYYQIAHICQMVEGHPLAVKQAADWVRYLSLGEIEAEMGKGNSIFAFPGAINTDQPDLRAVFSRSTSRLSASERQAINNLTLINGEFDLNTALEITAVPLPVLAALVDKSLLRRGSDGCFRMPALLRLYTREQMGPLQP